MPLTLVLESGAGVVGANSYASSAEGDDYHLGHLYATVWTAASSASKAAALVMATRLIDACWAFGGKRVADDQALQWPRYECPDPDSNADVIPTQAVPRTGFFASDDLPKVLVAATCELARCLLVEDLVASDIGDGVAAIRFAGTLSLDFKPGYRPSLLPPLVRSLLQKVGAAANVAAGAVKLQRC